MSKTTLYQKAKTGKIKIWSGQVVTIGKSGFPEIHYEWGLVDGKKQLTVEVISKGVNEGKVNETTPLQQAHLELERKIVKKKKEGYTDNLESVYQEHKIDFSKPLPKELCFYKPKNSIDEKKIKVLEENKQAVYTVKRDGMMHIVRTSRKFGVEIYSRRMDLVTDKYPHLVKEFSKLPPGLIFLGEMILDEDGKDNFNAVSQICRSDPDKAITKQEQLGRVSYYIFDLAYYYNDNALVKFGYKDRLHKIKLFVEQFKLDNKYIISVEVIAKPHKDALQEMQSRNLEGLVVWDAEGTMAENEAFTFNGKAYRPNVLWKSKPKYEDDFIIRFDPENGIGEFGKGKHYGKVGSVFCYQLNENNEEVFLGKCGGGLTDKQREDYAAAEYPRVWRVEFDSIQPKTGSLRFPVFNADRTTQGDKSLEECLMSDKIKQARQEK